MGARGFSMGLGPNSIQCSILVIRFVFRFMQTDLDMHKLQKFRKSKLTIWIKRLKSDSVQWPSKSLHSHHKYWVPSLHFFFFSNHRYIVIVLVWGWVQKVYCTIVDIVVACLLIEYSVLFVQKRKVIDFEWIVYLCNCTSSLHKLFFFLI